MSGSFDGRRFAQAFRGQEKQWVSYGIVDADESDKKAVRFKDDDGKPSPYGPMVSVTLQPSGISVPCRVASGVAGDGEADWYPFVAGDEVVVLIPEGSEDAGCLIIGRMNQELDKFPLAVAGQDATQNKFGFRRMVAPFVIETAGGYLIRSATTGSQIGIDALGQVIINDGDQGSMVIGPEAMGFSSGDGSTFMQLFPADKEVFLGADTASFLVSAGESKFISQGVISFSTSGAIPNQMAVTAEQVVALIVNVLAQLATSGSFSAGPLASGTYAVALPASAVAAINADMSPVLAAMATPTPFPGAPGGSMAPFLGTLFGPGGGISLASSNPLAPVDVTGTITGLGRPGFRL